MKKPAIREKLNMIVLPVLILVLCMVMSTIVYCDAGTITFTNGTGFEDYIASDGDGGSINLGGIEIQIYGIDNEGTILTTAGAALEYHDDSDWVVPNIVTFNDPATSETGTHGMAIKAAGGTNFKLSSFNFHDWGDWDGGEWTAEARNGGSSIDTIIFTGNTNNSYITVDCTTSGIFDNVDEVWIYRTGRDSWFGINDIVIGDSVIPKDADGNITAAGGVAEPVGMDTTIDTVGEAADIFDFTISDGGTSDGLSLDITQIKVHISGTSTDAERGKITFRLNGPDTSNVTGTYNSGTDTLTFSGLNISVADGGNETYTINAYYNDNSNLTEDHTLILSLDGDTDVSVSASGTQMRPTSAITNGSGSIIDVIATWLAFTTQPAGSVSGVALTTQPVVAARDAFGNTDIDFTETITLTEASDGALSNNTKAAVNGVATFTNVTYTATADQQSFTLTANDQDGIGADLPTVYSDAVTSDVVATKLVFQTQPAPTSIYSGEAVSFTTVPVVRAMDANNLVDTGYFTGITIAEVNGAGSDAMTAAGDEDGDSATVTITPHSGESVFTGLQIIYTASGSDDETFNLRASSGGLTTADSTQLTAIVNDLPSFDEGDSYTLDVDENTVNDTVIASLGVTDPDIGDSLTFSITEGNTGDAFRLSTLSGTSTGDSIPLDIIVNDSSKLDYETSPVFELTVESDDGRDSDTITVIIDINNLNDNIPQISEETFSIDENSPNGTSVGTVNGTDLDGDTLTYSIISGNDSGAFALNSSTGELAAADAAKLDYETVTG